MTNESDLTNNSSNNNIKKYVNVALNMNKITSN